MKNHTFKDEAHRERHERKADIALNRWLEKYTVSGLSVGTNADGNVVRMQFNSRTTYREPLLGETKTETTPDIFIDKNGKRTNKPPDQVVKKKKSGCSSCNKKQTGSSRLKRMITGGAKLLKSELGIDAADEATILERKNTCLDCDTYDFGVCLEEKGGCGCFVAAKIKLNSEECPKGKWKLIEVTVDGD